jgi:excisionase family DNA binding protein
MSKGTVTVSVAIREYGIGRSKLYELMTDGALPYSQFGGRRLIPRRALEKLIEARMVRSETMK